MTTRTILLASLMASLASFAVACQDDKPAGANAAASASAASAAPAAAKPKSSSGGW